MTSSTIKVKNYFKFHLGLIQEMFLKIYIFFQFLDEVFLSNIEKVDSVTLLRKDKVMNGVGWAIRFTQSVNTWPCLNDLGAAGVSVRIIYVVFNILFYYFKHLKKNIFFYRKQNAVLVKPKEQL